MPDTTRHILAADIGGTSSRFGCFLAQGDALTLEASLVLPTAGAASFTELVRQAVALQPGLDPARMDAAAFAVPGAVRGRRTVLLPNITWPAHWDEMQAAVGTARLVLLNDFAAQAHAVVTPALQDAELLKPGDAYAPGPVAVTGAGTGLGNCALLPLEAGGWTVVPAELGHAPFPFVGREEFDYQAFVMDRLDVGYPIGDHVVSGGGLALLHEFLSGEAVSPPEASARLDSTPRVAEWFARFYGRACRQYALAVVASGGVVVAGGVAAKTPALVRHPAFLQEFLNCPTQRPLLEAMPIRRNENELSGLWGAAHAGWQACSRPAGPPA
ncbi:glucokinase [Megalodesulfovibrio gigas]|uniref:Putative glucokinase n=1 Tax=Megalodesulfovibrio gigas (strain ATCC 19364 / DSM 1382 / NCIMB 9332 / VKM B-1759) TaxID=1121448 RepID=T2GAM3_MEGG1|nr:glucokinase [Megalodesulfovibrio gigas]AGW13229.1 putative glucokinase [Megalodesulfovibrio gigas DSM 1382 = ATCC 19364]